MAASLVADERALLAVEQCEPWTPIWSRSWSWARYKRLCAALHISLSTRSAHHLSAFLARSVVFPFDLPRTNMSSTVTITGNLAVNVPLVDKLIVKAEASFKSEAAKAAAANALNSALQDPKVLDKVSDSVKNLSSVLKEIRTLFEFVAGKLLSFDSEGFQDTRGEVIKLGPEWQALFEASTPRVQHACHETHPKHRGSKTLWIKATRTPPPPPDSSVVSVNDRTLLPSAVDDDAAEYADGILGEVAVCEVGDLKLELQAFLEVRVFRHLYPLAARKAELTWRTYRKSKRKRRSLRRTRGGSPISPATCASLRTRSRCRQHPLIKRLQTS
jgi:hypothetical protein